MRNIRCLQRINQTPHFWLIVAKHNIDPTGRTCDKMGVGYEAFKHQIAECEKVRGSCLYNQPQYIYAQDAIRVTQGKLGLHFAAHVGKANSLIDFFTLGSSTEEMHDFTDIAFVASWTHQSLVGLILNADAIRWIRTA